MYIAYVIITFFFKLNTFKNHTYVISLQYFKIEIIETIMELGLVYKFVIGILAYNIITYLCLINYSRN